LERQLCSNRDKPLTPVKSAATYREQSDHLLTDTSTTVSREGTAQLPPNGGADRTN